MKHHVFKLKGGVLSDYVDSFNSRKDAVYFCKVNQTLPLPNYEWEDEFCIIREDEVQQVEKEIGKKLM